MSVSEFARGTESLLARMNLASLRRMSSRVRSLYIVHFVMFVMSLSGSTIYTGLEPYLGRVRRLRFFEPFVTIGYNETFLSKLDPDATLTMYGIIVAGDALGQGIHNPPVIFIKFQYNHLCQK